ncbi:hypothetical protein IWX76_000570 [Pedobacter sp. CAN_A7]|uniref:reverse transcriptase domain-containing protein n=1 Tax=Pedobacter sp. CAN_A7 TaxID=2787722 RepID=UPI0018CA0A3F
MESESLYTEDNWNEFFEKTVNRNKIKTYKHFDYIFDFRNEGHKVKAMVSDTSLRQVAEHSFTPHLKILTKTPRYKFDEESDTYNLETKIRPISFASHFDSYIYSFYAFTLNQAYQRYIKTGGFEQCVLAYRSDLNGACNIQFAKRAFDSIKSMCQSHGKCTSIALDITGYFDNIDHTVLKEKWCDIIGLPNLPKDQYKVFRSLTNYSYVSKASLLKHFDLDLNKFNNWRTLLDLIPADLAGPSYREKFGLLRKRQLVVRNKPKTDKDGNITCRGIPQVSQMSSVLSNIYLIDFDKWLNNLSKILDFHYFRYCDDLLIVCKSENAKYLISEIIASIKNEFKLTIQERKSEIIEFRPNCKGIVRAFNAKGVDKRNISKSNEQRFYKNLQYLGFEYNGMNIYIRPGSLSRYFRIAKGRILKTMMMAYGKKTKIQKIYRKQLFLKYSHFGKRNFITYAQNASKKEYKNSEGIIREGLNSISIKRQLSAHFGILQKELEKESGQFSIKKGVDNKM